MNPPRDSVEESDEDLMLRVAAADAGAFRLLVERHQHLVVGTMARMIGTADAEDIAQQVFISVWKSAPRWRPDAKFTTWLMTIAKRLAFNESRRRSRARIVPQAREEAGIPEHEDASPIPDEHVLHLELQQAIDKALASLPEKERLAIVLRRYEEMPYEEMAAVLKTSVPGVKSLLFRARTALRQKLAPYLRE